MTAAPTLLLALALAAPEAVGGEAAPGDAESPKVLVLSLQAAGVEADEAKVLDGMIANALSPYRTIEVVTSEDLAQMMELEGQKQSLGCDTSSCLAEIAGAMGARYVVFGSAGRLGELFVLQLNLFDSVEAKSVDRQEIQAAQLEGLAPRVRPAVAALVRKVTDEVVEVEEVAPPPADGPGPLLLTGAGVAAAGLAIAGVGAVGYLIAVVTLNSPDSDRNGKDFAVDIAPWSVGALVVGSVVLAGGGTLAAVALGVE